jgi:hypothetical protein
MQSTTRFEMATAFGARAFGTALVVIMDSTDFGDKGPEWAFSDQCRVIKVDYQSGSKQRRLQRLHHSVDCNGFLFAQASNYLGLPVGVWKIGEARTTDLTDATECYGGLSALIRRIREIRGSFCLCSQFHERGRFHGTASG